ncbi:hypothetical protein ACYFX5_03675 [Bremerella sp. T1]|uniref:hypothetical protein n=1 Tax=Bremerella sp. TYQ1 TaxID=3119568 RepID=UPI001CCE083A|nr:hypothetical protein [Bremerella volcania]UBM37371.1 hypothetical protein LA756_05630 [Bremerella volcania]
MSDIKEKEPRRYFVGANKRKQAYEFIRSAIDKITDGDGEVDFKELEQAYERINRPWHMVKWDLKVMKRVKVYREQMGNCISPEEAQEVAKDAEDLKRQRDEMREQMRGMQRKYLAMRRRWEDYARLEYNLRDRIKDNPTLFASLDDLCEGGEVTEQNRQPTVVDEILETYSQDKAK